MTLSFLDLFLVGVACFCAIVLLPSVIETALVFVEELGAYVRRDRRR